MNAAQELVNECGDQIIALCHAGHSIDETIEQIQAEYPHYEADLLRHVMESSSLHFTEQRKVRFPAASIQAGLLAVLALKENLQTADIADAVNSDSIFSREMVEQLGQTVTASDGGEVPTKTMEKLLVLVAGAAAYLKENPDTVIGGTVYDQWRTKVAKRFKLDPAWPPTRQTVSARFGGWNEAIGATGFKHQSGRKKGQLKYSAADYKKVMVDYLDYVKQEDQNPSFASFTRWSKETGATPSPAAVRDFYGSWSAALRSGEDSKNVWAFLEQE